MARDMLVHALPLDDLTGWVLGATAPRVPPRAVIVVDLDDDLGWDVPSIAEALPHVVVGTTASANPVDHPAAAICDVVVAPDGPDLAAAVGGAHAHPRAALQLVQVLRGSEGRALATGLEVESRAYSDLQAGPEFAAWLAGHRRRERPAEGDPVRMERDDDVLRLTLSRPHVRNALDAATREALLDGLAVAAADPSIRRVDLRGDGPSFCSGGDLDEFGTFASPEAAHLLRLERSVARAIALVADRVVAHLHGACAGSGIELPAFAGRVVAAPDTTVRLPELALGLIPGAGGTVSLPARIGRHRTALLALTGAAVDAPTALAWGLVDEISERTS